MVSPNRAGQGRQESRPDSPGEAAQTSMPDKEQGDKQKFNSTQWTIQFSVVYY